MNSVKSKLVNFLKENILKSDDEIREDQHLVQEGILDSIAIMRLITYITEEFDIELDDEDFEITNFESINDMYKLIEEKSKRVG